MIWYNQGIHIQFEGLHILCDPSYTTDEHVEWEDYQSIRKKASPNREYRDVDFILVSHAHSDHIDKLEDFADTDIKVFAHPMTMRLKASLFSQFKNRHPISENETVEYKGAKITAYESGHCGGSLMFLIEYGGKRILFTGDLNTQNTISLNAAKPIQCDILIMEATFGDPKYEFPPRNVIYKKLHDKLNELFAKYDVVLLFGQALGKAQDIVKLIRNFKKNDIKIALDNYSYYCTQIFEMFYGKIDHQIRHLEGKEKQTYVQISDIFNPKPRTLIISQLSKAKFIETIATVSKQLGLVDPPIIILSGLDRELLLPIIESVNPTLYSISNHADYKSLVSFAKRCNPKKLCVFHGRAKEFKENARKEVDFPIYYIHKEKCKIG